jgi:hypothetical protein
MCVHEVESRMWCAAWDTAVTSIWVRGPSFVGEDTLSQLVMTLLSSHCCMWCLPMLLFTSSAPLGALDVWCKA